MNITVIVKDCDLKEMCGKDHTDQPKCISETVNPSKHGESCKIGGGVDTRVFRQVIP